MLLTKNLSISFGFYRIKTVIIWIIDKIGKIAGLGGLSFIPITCSTIISTEEGIVFIITGLTLCAFCEATIGVWREND